ncbi:MAG: hypothetical protein A2583_01080 [Bdellovibrionales bacterium RIFOXYD1_FULL_53_11]|nr:MAG: hypothetical protein A2583_01080 [Bdellovibrionales bacterium RIFOXYD1_FULL_53_11]
MSVAARVCVIAVVLLAFGAGCSSVRAVPNKRMGLFDLWATLDSPHGKDGKLRRPEWRADDDDDGYYDVATDEMVFGSVRRLTKGWRWPLHDVKVTSNYGPRGHEFHEGLDLRAGVGTPVFAAQSGKVLYSGRKIRGYGNLVVIRHESGLASVYAHNSRLFVHKGQRVRKGQRIALAGKTGKSRGPHLHFEIRQGISPVDPAKVLPAPS